MIAALVIKFLTERTKLGETAIARIAAIVPYVLVGLVLWGSLAFYGASREAEGRRKCEEEQTAANTRVEDQADAITPELDAADDDHFDTIQEATESYADTLDQTDIDQARRAGVRLGRTLERNAILAEMAAEGGCLVQPYARDSRMRERARSLQCDVFGDCDEAGGTGPADAVPALAGREAVPEAPQDRRP